MPVMNNDTPYSIDQIRLNFACNGVGLINVSIEVYNLLLKIASLRSILPIELSLEDL